MSNTEGVSGIGYTRIRPGAVRPRGTVRQGPMPEGQRLRNKTRRCRECDCYLAADNLRKRCSPCSGRAMWH